MCYELKNSNEQITFKLEKNSKRDMRYLKYR